MEIGHKLKAARADADLSQKEVEEKTGVAQNVISRIELCKVIPNCKTIEILLDCYGYELRIVKKGE